MIREELELYRYLGNFPKEMPPQADNTIRQARCMACNVLYRVEGMENGLCPFCRAIIQKWDFSLRKVPLKIPIATLSLLSSIIFSLSVECTPVLCHSPS